MGYSKKRNLRGGNYPWSNELTDQQVHTVLNNPNEYDPMVISIMHNSMVREYNAINDRTNKGTLLAQHQAAVERGVYEANAQAVYESINKAHTNSYNNSGPGTKSYAYINDPRGFPAPPWGLGAPIRGGGKRSKRKTKRHRRRKTKRRHRGRSKTRRHRRR